MNKYPKHNELEDKLKTFLDVPCVSLFNNGHSALEAALSSFNISGEVITTPFTFASTTLAIARSGLKPVFCDIDSANYTLDPSKIESLITPKTTAIVPVHVYGNICDVDYIAEIAEKHDLKVIYDAAHAFGVKYKGKGVGNYGDCSMFSFHATKIFNTIEGGCISYSKPEMYDMLKAVQNFGQVTPENIPYLGGNSKMNEFQAAMGLCNLKNINQYMSKRKILTQQYRECLENVDGIRLNEERSIQSYNYSYFPIVIDPETFGLSRDQLITELNKYGVYPRKYFYPLTCDLECLKSECSGCVNNARIISESIMTLPLYSNLTVSEV